MNRMVHNAIPSAIRTRGRNGESAMIALLHLSVGGLSERKRGTEALMLPLCSPVDSQAAGR